MLGRHDGYPWMHQSPKTDTSYITSANFCTLNGLNNNPYNTHNTRTISTNRFTYSNLLYSGVHTCEMPVPISTNSNYERCRLFFLEVGLGI